MFDPYHKWLGIPKDQRPPTLYQLLGLSPGETDAEVIEEASIRQSGHIRAYQVGPHAADCTRILNEIAQARNVLTNPAKRRAYEAKLAAQSKPNSQAVTAAAPNPDLDFSETPSARKRPARRAAAEPEARNKGIPLPLLLGIGGGGVALLAIAVAVLVVVLNSRPVGDPLAEGKPKIEIKQEIKKVDPVVPLDPKLDPKIDPKIELKNVVPKDDLKIDPKIVDPIVRPNPGGIDPAQSMFTVDGFMASPDGNFVLRTNAEGRVELIDQRARSFSPTPLRGGSPLRFSPDGNWIYSVDNTNSMFARLRPSVSSLIEHAAGTPIEAAFNHDGTRLAISLKGEMVMSPDGKPMTFNKDRILWKNCVVQVYDITAKPTKLYEIRTFRSPAESVAFTDDGFLHTTGLDGLHRCDARTGQVLAQLHHELTGSRLSPDGKRVVGVEEFPYHLASWGVVERKMLTRYPIDAPGEHLALSRDGRYAILAIAKDGVLGVKETALWDLETGEKLRRNDVASQCVSISYDGRIAHFQDRQKRVYRWDLGVDFAKGKVVDPPKDPKVITVPAVTKIDLPALDGSIKDPVMLIPGQPQTLASLAVSGDGRWMLHNANRFAQLTDLRTGETFALSMASGSRFSLSHDAKWIATAAGTRVYYCSFDDKKNIRDVRVPNTVREMAFSRDGSLFVIGTNGSSTMAISYSPKTNVNPQPRDECVVEVVDIATGQSVTCRGHECAVESVAVGDDGSVLSSARDGLRRWNAKTGKQIDHFEHNMFPSRISADSKTVVGFDVKTLQYTAWDILKEKAVHRSKALTQMPTMLHLAASPDGRSVLSCARVPFKNEEAFGLVDLQTGEQSKTVDCIAQHLALLPNNIAYYSDIRGHQIMRWQIDLKASEVPTKTVVKEVPKDPAVKELPLKAVEFEKKTEPITVKASGAKLLRSGNVPGSQHVLSEDGATLARVVNANAIELIDVGTGNVTFVPMVPGEQLALAPDASRVAAIFANSQKRGYEIRVFTPATRNVFSLWSPDRVKSVAFSRDGSMMLVGGGGEPKAGPANKDADGNLMHDGCNVQLFDLAAKKSILTCTGHHSEVVSVAFAENGTLLSAGLDGVRRWNAKTGRETTVFKHGLSSPRMSSDGRILFGREKGGALAYWSVDLQRFTNRLDAPAGAALDAEPSGDGRRLLVALGKNTDSPVPDRLTLYDLRTGQVDRQADVKARNLLLSRTGTIAVFNDQDTGDLWRWTLTP